MYRLQLMGTCIKISFIFSCRKLKDRLRKVKSDQEESCGTSTFTANVHLSTPEKLRKLSALAVERVESRRKIASLTAKVKALHAKEGISVDPELQQDLDDVMTQCQQVLHIIQDGVIYTCRHRSIYSSTQGVLIQYDPGS